MRRLVPVLAVVAATVPPAASADVVSGAPPEAVLGVGADGRPYVAYARFGSVFVTRRELREWRGVFGSPRLPPGDAVVRAVLPDVRIGQRYTGIVVLVQDRGGGWASLVVRPRAGARPVVLTLARGARTQVGPAGVTLAGGRLVAAYSVRSPNDQTELWVARLTTNRNGTFRLARTRITRRGFPPSTVPPAAAPLVARDGRLYVVQTWTQRGTTAIVWRRERGRWWGRVLFANTLGQSTGPVFAHGEIPTVFATFAVAFPAFGEMHLVLAAHEPGSRVPTWSRVLHRRATPVALVRERVMAEVAANELVGDLVAGLLVVDSGVTDVVGPYTLEFDGRIRDYVAFGQFRHLLLERSDGTLEWFFSPTVPAAEITLEVADTVRGRVGPLTSGTVRIYREVPGQARELVAEVPIAPDGTFTAPGVPLVSGSYYRAVWTDPRTGIPWAHLTRQPVP